MESENLLSGHVLVKVPIKGMFIWSSISHDENSQICKSSTHVEGFICFQSGEHKEKEGISYLINYDQPAMLMIFIKLNEQENEESDL